MRKYKVFEYDDFAACPKFPHTVCYRTIIALGFLHYFINIKASNEASSQTLKEIDNFVSAVTSNTPFMYELSNNDKYFLEFYPVPMKNEQYGFLYVDHTHSCYPLVLYPDKYNNNESRTTGFLQAAIDIGIEKDRLIDLFNKYSDILLDFKSQKKHFKSLHDDLHKFIHVNR